MSKTNPSVNRYLKNKDFDHMDHALGRPVDPMRKSYRNYFAIGENNAIARGFAASPNWKKSGQCDDMAYFAVTDVGREALAAHLKQIGDNHRLYDVTYQGVTQAVVAVSAAKAKYSLWLDISDCFCDLTFATFTRTASVRLSPSKEAA